MSHIKQFIWITFHVSLNGVLKHVISIKNAHAPACEIGILNVLSLLQITFALEMVTFHLLKLVILGNNAQKRNTVPFFSELCKRVYITGDLEASFICLVREFFLHEFYDSLYTNFHKNFEVGTSFEVQCAHTWSFIARLYSYQYRLIFTTVTSFYILNHEDIF